MVNGVEIHALTIIAEFFKFQLQALPLFCK